MNRAENAGAGQAWGTGAAGTAEAAPQQVRLVYQLTRRDWREALAARARVSRAARWQRRLLLVCLASVVCCYAALLIVAPERFTVQAAVAPVAFLLALLVLPRLRAAQLHRLTERNGALTVVAAADGLHVAHRLAAGHNSWQATPRYVETARLFVLLSGDPNASHLVALPKAGVQDPGGPDALRAVLDGHLRRV
ncbi:YcxB family protein [Streptomyces sp. NPDC059740]|uniref:YcxB family protein n=1 Tax=Streptomyces sp. NPDC059740 TaxID=3346926 RepID=UPI003650C124